MVFSYLYYNILFYLLSRQKFCYAPEVCILFPEKIDRYYKILEEIQEGNIVHIDEQQQYLTNLSIHNTCWLRFLIV